MSMSRSTTSHADDTLRRSALTTLNLDGRRLIRVASHISELCLRLHRSDANSHAFVIDTNFRYTAPPMTTGSRQPTANDVRKLIATTPSRDSTTQMSVLSVGGNHPTDTWSTPTTRPTSQQTATDMIAKRRVSLSRDRAIVAKATLATLPLRCFQLSPNLRLVDTYLQQYVGLFLLIIHVLTKWTAYNLSLIHIWRCRGIERCRSRWSPYH